MLGRMVGALVVVTGCDQALGLDQVPRDGAADGVVVDGPHACLDGTFSTPFDTGKYDIGQPIGGMTTVVNGQVAITWPSGRTGSNYGFVETQATFDLSAGEVAVDLITFVGDAADMDLYVKTSMGTYYQVTVDLATVQFYVNSGSGDHLVASMAYGVLPLRLRIYSDAQAMVTFEASTHDATFKQIVAGTIPLQSVDAGFSAGSYKAAQGSGAATFDNFLVASPTCL